MDIYEDFNEIDIESIDNSGVLPDNTIALFTEDNGECNINRLLEDLRKEEGNFGVVIAKDGIIIKFKDDLSMGNFIKKHELLDSQEYDKYFGENNTEE